YRSPALIYPYDALPELLTDFIPRVATSLSTALPDLSQIADLVDAEPKIELLTLGDIVNVEAKLRVHCDDHDFEIPPDRLAAPLAFLEPAKAGGRPRVIRRDVGSELIAVQQLMALGFTVDESREGLALRGDAAIEFWTSG